MSSRQSGGRNSQPPPQQAASARQNEYFVPRDGIDREVITADICRYLGNDALVRPGTYESPDGRITQGYFITAYRNLTSAMIQDLKADSARWDQERRAASQNRPASGAAGASSRDGRQDYRTSNTFRDREVRENREQYQGSSGGVADYGDAMAIDSYGASSAPRPQYPGTGNGGYGGVSGGAGYGSQPYGGQVYAASPYAGATAYGTAAATSDPRYGNTSMVPDYGHPQASSYMATAANYAPTGYAPDRMPAATGASRTSGYANSPSTGYPPVDASYYQQPTAGGYSQPVDPMYGRGAYNTTIPVCQDTSDTLAAPAGTAPTGYNTVAADPSQYDDSQTPAPASARSAATPSTSTGSSAQQLTNSGTSSSRREERSDRHRDRERDQERHHTTSDRQHRNHRTRQ